jgi:hypothetical protein
MSSNEEIREHIGSVAAFLTIFLKSLAGKEPRLARDIDIVRAKSCTASSRRVCDEIALKTPHKSPR